jgi:prepilin-type processing-associated H-X9-DG protein
MASIASTSKPTLRAQKYRFWEHHLALTILAGWFIVSTKLEWSQNYPYMRNSQIQACPDFQNSLRSTLGLTGYGYNYNYLSPLVPPHYEALPVSLARINAPAETVQMADSARLNTWQYATPTLEGNAYLEPPSSDYPTAHARHSGTVSVLWLDGHVKALQPTYRMGIFGWGNSAEDFRRVGLADIDRDGNMTTDELFDLD